MTPAIEALTSRRTAAAASLEEWCEEGRGIVREMNEVTRLLAAHTAHNPSVFALDAAISMHLARAGLTHLLSTKLNSAPPALADVVERQHRKFL